LDVSKINKQGCGLAKKGTWKRSNRPSASGL